MADTTPDTSHKDNMSTVARIVNDNGEAKERLVKKSVESTDKTGNGMAELILSSLNNLNVDTSKMEFQSYHYASSMSGKFQGVQTKIQSILVRELFNALEQLYVFFTSSTKLFRHLKEKVKGINGAVNLANL